VDVFIGIYRLEVLQKKL